MDNFLWKQENKRCKTCVYKDRCDLLPSLVSNTHAPPVMTVLHFEQFQIPTAFLFTVLDLHNGHLNFDLDFCSIVRVRLRSVELYRGPNLPVIATFFVRLAIFYHIRRVLFLTYF